MLFWIFLAVQLICVQDSDCVLRTVGCCKCSQGGKLAAVHKNTPQIDCEGRVCSQVMSKHKSCRAKKAVCADGACEMRF